MPRSGGTARPGQPEPASRLGVSRREKSRSDDCESGAIAGETFGASLRQLSCNQVDFRPPGLEPKRLSLPARPGIGLDHAAGAPAPVGGAALAHRTTET